MLYTVLNDKSISLLNIWLGIERSTHTLFTAQTKNIKLTALLGMNKFTDGQSS